MIERIPLFDGVFYGDPDDSLLVKGTYAQDQFEHECTDWRVIVPEGHDDVVYQSSGAALDAARATLRRRTWAQDGSHHEWEGSECAKCGAWSDEWEQLCL